MSKTLSGVYKFELVRYIWTSVCHNGRLCVIIVAHVMSCGQS